MKWLKKVYKKVKKPVEWIEIPLPKSFSRKKDKESLEEKKTKEEE